jgi:hypothetical protein
MILMVNAALRARLSRQREHWSMAVRQTGADGRKAGGRAPKSPPAPGGSLSPQQPGMTPDRTSIPEHFSTSVPRATSKRRPLSQYGTSEEIMKVFKRKPEDQIKPEDFEQATASGEELRKAYLNQLPPVRPVPPALPEAQVEAISAESTGA